jgi:undecaprenyl-diphosphatase
LFFGIALNFLLKSMFQRPRPTFLPLVQENFYSFPSGHAMNSFIFYTSLSFFIFRRIRNKYLRIGLIFLSMMFILLIGISRVYLGAHYASDVVAGYVTGFLWFVLVLFFEKSLVFLKLFKRYRAYSKRTYYF